MIVVAPLGDGVGALELKGGSFWGQPVDPDARRRRTAGFEKTLEISSAAGVFAAAGEDAEAILRRIHDVVETEMPNSSLSRFAQGWALRISDMLSRRLATAAWEAPPPSGLLDVAAPAPGYHDAVAFPELDVQPIPQGADNDHLLAAAEEDDAKAAQEQQEQQEQEQEQAVVQAMDEEENAAAKRKGVPAGVAAVAGAEAHDPTHSVQDQISMA